MPLVRLFLAWAVTLGVLVYCWGRILVFGMLTGRPERILVIGLVAGVLLVALLVRRLRPMLQPLGWSRFLPWLVAGSWIAVTIALISYLGATQIPLPYFCALFVLNTLWLPWLAWLPYSPGRWLVKFVVLALLIAAAFLFPRLIDVPGLTGEGWPEFVWRAERKPPEGAAESAGLTDFPQGPTADTAQYRGPGRLGVYDAVRLDPDWEKHPPRLLWRRSVGIGWSSFAVVGDYAITQEQRGDDECVVCYRLRTGEPCWVHADRVRFDSSLGGPGPRATPTVDRGRVYSVGATGLLNCLDGATGKTVWSKEILADNHAENIAHGVCASPLLLDEKVIVCPTGAGGPSLVAYHRDTGERIWQGGTDQASYGSPVLTKLAGEPQILLMTSAGAASHNPKTGQLLWRFEWTNSVQVNCAQPIAFPKEDKVLLTSGYGTGGVLLKVSRSGDGGWSPQEDWTTRSLKTKFTSAVQHAGFAYGLDDGVLACVALADGKQKWKRGRYGHGQVVLVNDWLLVQAESGEVIAVEATPTELNDRGRIPALDGKTWNYPALAGRVLLVRNAEEAACYELGNSDSD